MSEGQKVRQGDALAMIDDSVQRATAEQQRSQADAALALLKELNAEPRPETAIRTHHYHQAAALYRQTVLSAFAQVADTLQALDHDAATLKAQDVALGAAADSLHLVQANYAAGLDGYLDVLLADAQYHQARISDLQSIAVRYQDTVALYVALGGGWWNTPRTSAKITP